MNRRLVHDSAGFGVATAPIKPDLPSSNSSPKTADHMNQIIWIFVEIFLWKRHVCVLVESVHMKGSELACANYVNHGSRRCFFSLLLFLRLLLVSAAEGNCGVASPTIDHGRNGDSGGNCVVFSARTLFLLGGSNALFPRLVFLALRPQTHTAYNSDNR